ncbi:uncharacterized protein LOC113315565 [Papaver somniferum]|uniref:uncharacterized protein LOC113315565 n=1 Tax=Papaver somniferum TaxID=3469 RepID=UPI000E70402B|nr:uncharacterized protein LOC113315565 [Papaver somniferum]
MWNTSYDLQILKEFDLKSRKVKHVRIMKIYFQLPGKNELLLCCDGESKGNPGISGYGFIGRNNGGEFFIAVTGGLGIATNFCAEVMVVINAYEWAVSKGFHQLIFRIDSSSVMTSFKQNRIPWYAVSRWKNIYSKVSRWKIIHSYRVVNFSADKLANIKGSL